MASFFPNLQAPAIQGSIGDLFTQQSSEVDLGPVAQEGLFSRIDRLGPVGGISSLLQTPQAIRMLGQFGAALSPPGSQGDRLGTAAAKMAEGAQADQRQAALDAREKAIAKGKKAALEKELEEASAEQAKGGLASGLQPQGNVPTAGLGANSPLNQSFQTPLIRPQDIFAGFGGRPGPLG